MKRWRKHFLQDQRNVEAGYLSWLLLHFLVFFAGLFVVLSFLLLLAGRFSLIQMTAFCFLMGMLLAATHVYVDHYTLCPARSTDEAYRAVQSSILIWLLFGVGAVFFTSHYSSLFFFFCMIWIAIYAAYLHFLGGRKALKPARDDLLPTSALRGEESAEYTARQIVEEIIHPHKARFLERAKREGWDADQIRVEASREFL